MKKASFTAVFTWRRIQGSFRGCVVGIVSRGYSSIIKIRIRDEAIIRGVGCIATTWICTKSLWFLRPTDELLSFRSSDE